MLLDPGSNFSRKDLAKVSYEAFWRGQSILNCRLEGDNILIKVMRKQIKWSQNVSLETTKLKYTTLLINELIFILIIIIFILCDCCGSVTLI